MWLKRVIFLAIVLSGLEPSMESEDVGHHSTHNLHMHKIRRQLAANDTTLRFAPEPYSKKLELNSSGKIHCKVAGGVSPTVQWFLNEEDPLPEGVTSQNGTLLVTEASRAHAGQYTCRAVDSEATITANIHLNIVVSPQILEPSGNDNIHATIGQQVVLNCRAIGDPQPTIHWDRNLTMLHPQQDGVDVEDSVNASSARLVLLNNGSLLIRNVQESDAARYSCTAGSPAGLDRKDLELVVHAESGSQAGSGESTGVGGKAVLVSVSVAAAYMVLVLALMVYCRRRRLRRRHRGEKMEQEMVEGREKLVEEGEEERKKVGNGAPLQNGRLFPHDKDSGADNSEVSGVSRVSKKSGQYDHLAVPRSLLTDQITLGRGEFGEVLLAKIDVNQVKRLRSKESEVVADIRPVLVKALTTKDEVQLVEFRRQLELLSHVRHDHVARLIGICSDEDPHYMLIEHTDWGDLKSFLIATRTTVERSELVSRVGASHAHLVEPPAARVAPPLAPEHSALLATHLAAAAGRLAAKRVTHRDIAARNCIITSQLHLKLSYPALTQGPDSHEYFKIHDQVIPLRWLPLEAVAEGEYSTKSDVYMFAATIWEIYTKAELPFAKLNDNSVLERLKSGTLDWTVPSSMPDNLATLLKRCWNKSPADRPQFTDICEEMNSILKDVTSENVSQKSQDKNDE